MKLSKRVIAMSFAGILIAFMGCKSDTSANSPNSGGDTGPYDTKGSDYFPLAANQQVSAHFRGAAKTYDLNGSLTNIDSIDQDRMATTLSSTVIQGLTAYQIRGYDDHGALSRDDDTYAAESNGVVYAVNRSSTDRSIVLPANLSAGPWNPDPKGDPKFSAKLAAHMSTFTTYNGNSFDNVIKVTATVKDSSSDFYNNRDHVNVTDVTASFYFAKDVGPIQVDFDHFEAYDYKHLTNGTIEDYERLIYTGSVARNK